jgi:hypothetical protein
MTFRSSCNSCSASQWGSDLTATAVQAKRRAGLVSWNGLGAKEVLFSVHTVQYVPGPANPQAKLTTYQDLLALVVIGLSNR